MQVLGEMLIGSQSVRGQDSEKRALDPSSLMFIEPVFGGGGALEIDRACRLAADAFDSYSRTSPEQRALFLNTIADNLDALAPILAVRCVSETGLTQERVLGEISWTTAQLRLFSEVVLRGLWRNATIDSEDSDVHRMDLRMHKVALGPVAIFGASNFPILYSVAGGDTASALASGCPVVVKAHPSHLGTSELVGRVIQRAVAECGIHEGVFSLVFGEGDFFGEALVDHPSIKAVAFTGSEAGGRALVKRGMHRNEPIPVFAEMTSANPHFLLPHALAVRATSFATRFIEQMVAGVGQMCLTPGVIVAVQGEGFDELRDALRRAISVEPSATMLALNIRENYGRAVHRIIEKDGQSQIAHGLSSEHPLGGQPYLFEIDGKTALNDISILNEIFGPSAILVRCESKDEMLKLPISMRGQLSMVMHMEEEDMTLAKRLLPKLEEKTGRVIVNGYSNMVQISDAQIHGGPFPATSDPRFTSVGSSAVDRFLRPISYQNFPPALLPPSLQDDNPLKLWRVRDKKPSNL